MENNRAVQKLGAFKNKSLHIFDKKRGKKVPKTLTSAFMETYL